MLLLVCRNLLRRPLRSALTLAGLAVSVAVLLCLSSFEQGYSRALSGELDRMGIQMMLVPLGCPYDAAARVLKGNQLENSIPDTALEAARRDPAVAVAAPLLMVTMPRPDQGRADAWVGLDESALELKPWWHPRAGRKWFDDEKSVILGCDAAEIEMRAVGDRFFNPETGTELTVAGILERSGTSDDSLFFVPLRTAQQMFQQPGRLTAIALRLSDPALAHVASERLQQIPGAQVVTLTEMMGTFLSLIGSVRTLLLSIGLVALVIGVLGVLNTLLAAVVERTNELSVMRALGASRFQIGSLMMAEALLLAILGSALGIALAAAGSPAIEHLTKSFVPLAPRASFVSPTLPLILQSLALGAVAGMIGALYPAWQASRLHPAAALKAE